MVALNSLELIRKVSNRQLIYLSTLTSVIKKEHLL